MDSQTQNKKIKKMVKPLLDGFNRSYIYMVIDNLTTKEACYKHILEVFKDKGFNWYDYRGYPEDELGRIHHFLLKATNKFPKEFGDYVKNFENACRDIILDKETFFTKIEWGNSGTTSEYVGTTLVFNFTGYEGKERSTAFKKGGIAKKIIPYVRPDDFFSGKIKKSSSDFTYQYHLLQLLYFTRTREIPGKSLVEKIKNTRMAGWKE